MVGKIYVMPTTKILSAIWKKGIGYLCIATATANTDVLITKLKLTRKQYYSRMSNLVKLGLAKRENGRYLLTSFGKVIYSSYQGLEGRIDAALDSYWKLKAVDSLEFPSTGERNKVISILIDNPRYSEHSSDVRKKSLTSLVKKSKIQYKERASRNTKFGLV